MKPQQERQQQPPLLLVAASGGGWVIGGGGLLGVPAESKLSLQRGLKRLKKAGCKERVVKVPFIQGEEKKDGN